MMVRSPFASITAATAAAGVRVCCAALSCMLGPAALAQVSPVMSTASLESLRGLPQSDRGMSLTPEVTPEHSLLAPPAPGQTSLEARPLTEVAGVSYRLWVSRGRADLGVGVGTLGYVVPAAPHADAPSALNASAQTVTLGVRYRFTSRSAVYADASGVRGLGLDTGAGYVNTKLGVEWKPAKPRYGLEKGAFGMQLDSGYKLTLRPRRGGLALYLRGQF